ncbi:unnamed protein product [Linum trigynum]|uniref:Uncharacterized protein n=1 Tax=Linum trigynum TaxID=586398 RepID=A0AAV2GLG9_9ROSI
MAADNERRDNLEQQVAGINQSLQDILAALRLGDQPHNQRMPNPLPRRDDRDGYRIKAEIPIFNGSLEIEPFLDWLNEAERFFEIMEISDERKVSIVAYKLRGGTGA